MSEEKKFDSKSTAMEVIAGHDLTGYDIIVTGGASGIGVETVRALAKAGARVVIATRDLKKAKEVAEELKKDTGSNKIEAMKLDLASLKSVREFTKEYLALKRPLHILVNNAGVMACPLSFTEDGFEMQIGTNHFGHFALTMDLLPALKEAAKQSGRNSRVVNVSSLAHCRSNILFDDYNFKKTPYDPFISYGQSKTANVLFSVALTKRFAKDGIISTALMPGAIMTNLQRHFSLEEMKSRGWLNEEGNNLNPNFKTIEQGASTTVWACVASELQNKGGVYLQDCRIIEVVEQKKLLEELGQRRFPVGVVSYALDEEAADRLWKISEDAIKEAYDKLSSK